MIKIKEFSKPETELNLICDVIYMTIEKGEEKGQEKGRVGREACR